MNELQAKKEKLCSPLFRDDPAVFCFFLYISTFEHISVYRSEAACGYRVITDVQTELVPDHAAPIGIRKVYRWVLEPEQVNAREPSAEQHAILTVDLNGLKKINDTPGHEAGDQMIPARSDILRNSLPRSSVICRWDGDEFPILLTGVNRERLDQHIQMLFAEGEQYNLEHPELANENMHRNKQLWYADNRTER